MFAVYGQKRIDDQSITAWVLCTTREGKSAWEIAQAMAAANPDQIYYVANAPAAAPTPPAPPSPAASETPAT